MLTNPDFLDCYHARLTTSRQHLDPVIAQLVAASARSPRTSTLDTCTDAPATRDVEQISQCLYEAWRDGDRETASAVAWPHVVDELFALTPGPPWKFLGCEQFSCTYVEPAPGEIHGVQIKFDVFADIDGDGLWYVHTMEIFG